ncbi:MAG: hypothetical protein CR960_01150 [Pasteurellales bacterium]|nr:MAG: hypothetical protein CR960_01150 [Pasteurellales bacterium]
MKESEPLLPREKLLKYGVEYLTDVELIAIFLRTGIKGLPVMQLSENVLETFGSLRELLTADIHSFCKIKGLGKTQFIQLQATKEIAKRYLNQKIQLSTIINEPLLAILYFQSELEDYEREVFMVIFLNNQNQVIKSEKMFFGTINQATVHPREVIKEALKCNAAAILVAHNHPSGNCTPSKSDRELTNKIIDACDLVDIRFVDHIIVGKGDYFSFKEEENLN